MKYTVQILFLLTLTGLLWLSCDRVDEGLVVTDVQNIPINTDTVFVIDSVVVTSKQVLLEDFTGHKCVNCPEAAVTAHEWIEEFDHRLILYAVHAGFQAFPDNSGEYTYDFTNPTSDELFNYFSQPFNPSATVNRVEYDGNTILFFVTGDWEAAVNVELAKPNVIDMKLLNKYFPNDNSVQIDVTVTPVADLTGTYKLAVMIVEDLIVRPQKNNNGDIGPVPDWYEYEHKDVLRDAVSATFGQSVSPDGTMVQGESYFNRFYYTMDQSWVSDTASYSIISFVFDESNDNILQAAKLGVKKEE
jgi:hypothetical protein